MLYAILETLRLSASNDDSDARRSYERRENDSCVALIDGVTYPVKNWSKGGILIAGEPRQFSLNDVTTITLRFKLADKIVDVLHSGKILRKGRDKFAMQFAPLTQSIERQFNYIVNDFITQEFVSSQTI